jgi:hypothetical protein
LCDGIAVAAAVDRFCVLMVLVGCLFGIGWHWLARHVAAVGGLVAWYTAAVLEACYIIAVVLYGILHNVVVLYGMLVVSRW